MSYEQFDNEESLREAKRRLPLNRLMEQYGDAPPPIGMKWGRCPFCKKKSTARITDSGTQLFFKCANDTCPSATAGDHNAWTELHYLAFKSPGLNPKDVFIAYLKTANVWREIEKHKPPPEKRIEDEKNLGAAGPVESGETPGQENGDTAAPNQTDGDGHRPPLQSEDEELVKQCIAVILQENRASVSLLQRRLHLGYSRAARIMDELEKRGIVGPSRGAEPREILFKKPDVPKTAEQLLDEDIAKWIDYLKRSEKRTFNCIHMEATFGFARAKEVFEAMKARQLISPAGTEGDMELTPKPAETVVFISSNDKPKTAQAGKIDGEDGYAGLHEFFTQLNLSERDGQLLFEKRGLKSSTQEALRFKSNPRMNRGILLGLKSRIAKEELLDSGVFVRVKQKHSEIKPNSQFCGWGIIRKLKPGEEPERNEWKDEDGNLWGWCEPVLIPYFDERGRLIGLRPHKGGARANTAAGSPKIYIPRIVPPDGKPIQEFFPKVIITEGEFKAAALWQTVGGGRIDAGEAYGVAALPGIWLGQNYAIREQLDQWLRDVRCRVVKVAYDNEEKGNPDLETFKPDRRKRFDAEICARVLATDIANKLHIRGEVCRLPDSWRNERGKADWDGALVQLTQPKN